MPCERPAPASRSRSSKLVREICVLKKVGHQPGFDAFQFAGPDGGFDLLEIGVLRAEDHAVDGMFVEHVRELLDRGFSEAQFADHRDPLVQSFLQFAPEPGNFGMRADQEETALVLGPAELAAQGPPHQLLLQIDQGEADAAKKRHHRARRNKIQGIHDQHQADGGDQAALEERPDDFPSRAKGGAVIETLGLKNQRRGGDQRKIKPDDAVEDVGREQIQAQPGDRFWDWCATHTRARSSPRKDRRPPAGGSGSGSGGHVATWF